MTRKVRRVPVRLDPKNIPELPANEIKAILRGADDLIMRGGRGILAKILKGSKEKKVIEHNFNKSPVYGYFNDITIEEITAKIDWLILNGFLKIEYDYRLPLLVYARKGWEIEMDTYTDELLKQFDDLLETGKSDFDMTYLKDRNREMILLLLDKVEATGDSRYIQILKAWKIIDYRKVRQRIDKVINKIQI
jgi:hypothetical protein